MKKIRELFLMIPYYLRGIVVFAIIVVIAIIVNKYTYTKPIDYWDTEIGKAQLEAINQMTEQEKQKNMQNANLQQNIVVDKTNNNINVKVKENQKVSPSQKIFNNIDNDVVFGSVDAPITIIEYSSYTCPHCQHFHIEVMPQIMQNYINTNKIKYAKRMVIQKNTILANMLPFCVDNSKKYNLLTDLFKNSNSWLKDSKKLKEIALNHGFTEETFDSCIKDTKLAQKLIDKQDKELREVSIYYTPSVFINGEMAGGGMSYEEFSKKIDKKLKELNK